MQKRVPLIISVILILLIAVTGCGSDNKKEAASDKAANQSSVKNTAGTKKTGYYKNSVLPADVAAKVNGEAISTGDFERRVFKNKFVLKAKGTALDGPNKAQQLKDLQAQVIQELVLEKVISQEAAKKGVVVTDQQVTDKINQIKVNFDSPEIYKKTLESRGLTEDAMNQYFKLQITQEGLHQKFSSDTEFNQFVQDKFNQAKVELNESVITQVIEKG